MIFTCFKLGISSNIDLAVTIARYASRNANPFTRLLSTKLEHTKVMAMVRTTLRRWLLALLLVAEFLGDNATCIILVAAAKEKSTSQKTNKSGNSTIVAGPFSAIHNQYRLLSPNGRAITGASVGFIGSRLALRTVTKVVKVGAGFFIAYVHFCFGSSTSYE